MGARQSEEGREDKLLLSQGQKVDVSNAATKMHSLRLVLSGSMVLNFGPWGGPRHNFLVMAVCITPPLLLPITPISDAIWWNCSPELLLEQTPTKGANAA